jgi:hypothetical protein
MVHGQRHSACGAGQRLLRVVAITAIAGSAVAGLFACEPTNGGNGDSQPPNQSVEPSYGPTPLPTIGNTGQGYGY